MTYGGIAPVSIKRSALGNSLAPIFAADFLPEEPKFNQRTLRVCLISLRASGKKSSCKSGCKEIPRKRYMGGGRNEA